MIENRMHRLRPALRGLALASLALVPFTAGCRVDQPVPRYANIGHDEGALAGWAHVLREHVDDSGNVDYRALKSHPEPLERYVTWLAHNGPDLSPSRHGTREEKLAFYLNAYNALAMYNVITSGYEPDQKLRFFYRSRMRIDGQYTSLYELEKKRILTLGEERVHFGLNCMTKSCPRLRREPFTPELVDDQLERAAVEFFNDPRHVRYDADKNRVRMSWLLDEFEKDFERSAPSVVAYANRYRANPLPEDARVKTIRWDWSLNAQ